MEDNPVATLMMRLVKMMDKNPYIKKHQPIVSKNSFCVSRWEGRAIPQQKAARYTSDSIELKRFLLDA